MTYHIQIKNICGGWSKPDTNKIYGGYLPTSTFTDFTSAFRCVTAYTAKVEEVNGPGVYQVRIVNTNGMQKWINTTGVVQTLNEGDNMATPTLNKPLNLKREDVITKLNENLATEVAKREALEAERTKEREEVLGLIAEFTPDELYNIFLNRWVVDADALKLAKERKTFVTEEIKPTTRETDTEKFVRVLGMTDDKTIEVLPSEDLYNLL